MKPPSRDEEREQRITMEIVVDAYTPEEQAMGWYSSLEDRLHFPFVEVGWVRGWRGSSCSVSSPSPSNRACGSPAHGSPTSFTGGVRPEPARAGSAWGRRRFH
jgi:hypothetical protein